MNKKVLIIILIIITIILGLGIYFIVEKNEGILPFSKEELSETEKGTVTDKLSQLKKIYQGFREAKSGDWIVWKTKAGDETSTVKYVFVGKETINGKDCYGWEFSGDFQGMNLAFQMWASKEDNTPVKYVAKAPQGVFCLSPSTYKPQGNISPQAGTPEDYKPENITKLNFETGTFTTETGKTINIVKVINPDGSQGWVSSDIPFGIAKIISPEGEVLVELKDFGSGAPFEITKTERDNCQQFPSGLLPRF